jgi:hypothetical protein
MDNYKTNTVTNPEKAAALAEAEAAVLAVVEKAPANTHTLLRRWNIRCRGGAA